MPSLVLFHPFSQISLAAMWLLIHQADLHAGLTQMEWFSIFIFTISLSQTAIFPGTFLLESSKIVRELKKGKQRKKVIETGGLVIGL